MQVNQIVNKQYEITRAIPSGPNNHIYIARDTVNDRTVVLKTFAQIDTWNAILLNKQNLLSLSSDYIPKTYVADVLDGVNCIVEEYIDGTTLNKFLAEHMLTYQKFFDIFSNLLDALDALHRCRLVHGDVKPQNIFVKTGDGSPVGVLIDIDSAFMHERRKTFYGTLAYAAPEQLLDNCYLPKTDIYALGLVAYYMIEGQLPFHTSKEGLRKRAFGVESLKLTNVQDDFLRQDLQTLLNEMVSTQPEERPSIANIKRRLHNILNKAASMGLLSQNIRAGTVAQPENTLFDKTQCVELSTTSNAMPVDSHISDSHKTLRTYHDKLMEEYDIINKQAAAAFVLWVVSFIVGLLIVVIAVVLICVGKYQEALLSFALEALIHFAQKIFAIREDAYREQNNKKIQYLERAVSWDYLMATLKNKDPKFQEEKLDMLWTAVLSIEKKDS